MIYQSLTVQKSWYATNSRPRLCFTGDWITEIGFVPGALVQALPEPGGFVFNLCNENVNYSELFNSTNAMGGGLIRVYRADLKLHRSPTFVTTGKYILSGGLCYGDALVAKCEYGCIRIRKVMGDARLITVGRQKDERTGAHSPKVWLWGDWLDDIGFSLDTLVTIEAKPGYVTLDAHDKAASYSDVVKLARKKGMRLIMVAAKGDSLNASFSGPSVSRAGFAIGDMLTADYEYGLIKLQKLDPGRFGF